MTATRQQGHLLPQTLTLKASVSSLLKPEGLMVVVVVGG